MYSYCLLTSLKVLVTGLWVKVNCHCTHTVNSYGRVEVQFHPFLYSAMDVLCQLLYRVVHYERQRSPCPSRTKVLLYLAVHSKELANKTRKKSQFYSYFSIPSSLFFVLSSYRHILLVSFRLIFYLIFLPPRFRLPVLGLISLIFLYF
jgi:hypothetical protein